MLTAGNYHADIEDVLAILGADAAAEVRIAASRGWSSQPGYEYVARLRSDPRKALVLPTTTVQALLAAGAVLVDH